MRRDRALHVRLVRAGLPDRLLRLFEPRDALPRQQPVRRKKPKLPFTGIAQYVGDFAQPGDAEYEPAPPTDRPASPRKFRNRELVLQVRLDGETQLEK